jgi:hypothetical protein|tara:strand:+ start:55 stop:501 length:447 start_codon:yes stop_codon:yes gene_type:complete
MAEQKDPTLYADGFDKAIIGFAEEWIEVPRVIYSKAKMQDILIEQGMSVEEALEYLEFNVWGAYVGEGTPIYANDLSGTTRQEVEYVLDLYAGGDGGDNAPAWALPSEDSPQLSESDSNRNSSEKRETLEKDNPTENSRSSSDEDIRS